MCFPECSTGDDYADYTVWNHRWHTTGFVRTFRHVCYAAINHTDAWEDVGCLERNGMNTSFSMFVEA